MLAFIQEYCDWIVQLGYRAIMASQKNTKKLSKK